MKTVNEIMELVEHHRTAGGSVEHHATKEALRTAIEELHKENALLKTSLNKANAQAEHFEREWYLCMDKNETLRLDAERFRFANESEHDFAICYWDDLMGESGEWMCNGYKGNSIDLLDSEIAKTRQQNST